MAVLTPDNVVAWHGRDSVDHEALTTEWESKGYRLRSLSVYGRIDDLRWAAVLVLRPEVIDTRAVGPIDIAGMRDAIDQFAGEGWRPYLVTATGPRASAVFAAVFAPADERPVIELEVTGAELSTVNTQMQAAGLIPISIDAYGTAKDVCYAALWISNPGREVWSGDAVDEDDATWQARFEALVPTGCRPAHVVPTPTGGNAGVFVDSIIGPWTSRTGLLGDDGYQSAVDDAMSSGLMPLQVSASGSASRPRFAAIFAGREDIDQHTHRASGPVAVPGIDQAMQSYVQDHDLRGAALAITNGTRLVYAKGYTYAEPTYPDVLPTTVFRQASVSKAYAAVACWRLMEQNPAITSGTTMQSVLNLPNPGDSRFATITLGHLLESRSGLSQALWSQAKLAAEFAKAQLPASPDQLARLIASTTLVTDPGTTTVYGNVDYFLLSQVIAALAGTPTFEAALTSLVLSPLGMTRTRGARSLVAAQATDEARYHQGVYDPGGTPALVPLSILASVKSAPPAMEALQYGAFDWEMLDGTGGLSSAIVDVARLVAMFSSRAGNPVLAPASLDALFGAAVAANPKPAGGVAHGFDDVAAINPSTGTFAATKTGRFWGTEALILFTTGGLGFAVVQNGNLVPGVQDWLGAVAAVAGAHAWPAGDLFPTYGMPALTPSPPTPSPAPTPSSLLEPLSDRGGDLFLALGEPDASGARDASGEPDASGARDATEQPRRRRRS